MGSGSIGFSKNPAPVPAAPMYSLQVQVKYYVLFYFLSSTYLNKSLKIAKENIHVLPKEEIKRLRFFSYFYDSKNSALAEETIFAASYLIFLTSTSCWAFLYNLIIYRCIISLL